MEVTDELEAFGRLRASRDEMIIRALAEGVTRKEIARLTGLGHATIERIVARLRANGQVS